MLTDAITRMASYSNVVEKPDGTTYYTGLDEPTLATGKKESEKDMFLKLMIEQMRQQDPLNPMDSTQMLSQLAQLNVVQQMIDLNTSFERFMTNNDLVGANNLMGRWVQGMDANLSLIDGKVEWIEIVDGVVTLHLGDKLLLLNQVISVRDEAPPEEGDAADTGGEDTTDGTDDGTGQAA